MSDYLVPVVRLDDVIPHPNADRLELALIDGWQVCVQKGAFKKGDEVAYFTIDCILPQELEAQIFPPDSKIKLKGGRVRAEKIRKEMSFGFVHPLHRLNVTRADDLATALGVTKFEPEEKEIPAAMRGKQAKLNNNFPKFNKPTHLRASRAMAKRMSGHAVVSEKIHGTNFRAGLVPHMPKSWWQRLLKFFGLSASYEFCFGSMNVQLKKGGGTVYEKIVDLYRLDSVLPMDTVIYGEIYGPDIQSGFHYGLKPGQFDLAVFEVRVHGLPLPYLEARNFCDCYKLKFVPVLHVGSDWEEHIDRLQTGASVLAPSQPIREGVVVAIYSENLMAVTKFKHINPDYLLLKDTSDFH